MGNCVAISDKEHESCTYGAAGLASEADYTAPEGGDDDEVKEAEEGCKPRRLVAFKAIERSYVVAHSQEATALLSTLRLLFIQFDENGDGRLGAAELAALIKDYTTTHGVARPLPAMKQEVETLLLDYDHNGNGSLEFCEFVAMVSNEAAKLQLPEVSASVACIMQRAIKEGGMPWEIGGDEAAIPWADAATWGSLPQGPIKGGTNCWSCPQAQIFKVRGKTYLKVKKKVKSGPPLCRLLAVDFSDAPLGSDMSHLSRHRNSPISRLSSLFLTEEQEQAPSAPPFGFVVNFLVPFNSTRSGTISFYFVRLQDELRDEAAELFAYLMRPELDDNVEGHRKRSACVKVIPIVREGPWLAKKTLASEKPAIVTKKTAPTWYRGVRYIEVSLDCTTSMGASIVSVLRAPLREMVIDMAFVLEGKTEAFLPERILGTVRLSHLDTAQTVPWDVPPYEPSIDQAGCKVSPDSECRKTAGRARSATR